MADEVAYTSRVKIERIKGPLRRAYLPQVPTPVFFGVHSEIAQHYGVDTNVHEPHAATLDYVVAAAAGKFGVSHFILIDSLNFVFELVGATNTYLSLIEQPELVRRAVDFAGSHTRVPRAVPRCFEPLPFG